MAFVIDSTVEFADGQGGTKKISEIISSGLAGVTKTTNRQEFVSTANQTTFTISNGSYATGTKTLSVYIEGVLQPPSAYTEVNSTSFKLNDALPAGITVVASWLEGSMPVAFGHKSSHEKGGQDELDVLKLANADTLATKTDLLVKADKDANTVNLSAYAQYKNGTDWIPAFTKAFADLAVSGGGIVRIPAGTFYIGSTLTVPSNVKIIGLGIGTSVIRLMSGKDCDIVTLDTNKNCGLSYVTIYGNKDDVSPANNKDGLVLGRAGLSSTLNNGNMPGVTIHDVEIKSVSGNGFHCYPSTWVYFLSRINISYCSNYGAFIESTDNLYDTFYVLGCGSYGVYVTGSNNRLSNMKIIFNGNNNTLTDFQRAGMYCSARRNTLVNIECQENYGHGFVFESVYDTEVTGLLSDANGYSMIANGSTTPTASGFYFKDCQRMGGTLKATNFKTTLSQYNGYVIDTNCNNLFFDYENDRTAMSDVNVSVTSLVRSAKDKIELYAQSQYSGLLTSGATLTNKITGYNTSNFNLYSSFASSYTITGNEIKVMTNWSSSPRLTTMSFPVTKNRTYVIKLKMKAEVDNYSLKVFSIYNEGNYDSINKQTFVCNSTTYSDYYAAFNADRDSNNFIVYVLDKLPENLVQKQFYVKDVSIIDVTDLVNQGYVLKTIQKMLESNYFVGSKTLS